jgi:hypothetical protein
MQHFTDWVSAVLGKAPYTPGNSPLEQLPNELLSRILDFLVLPVSEIRQWSMFDELPCKNMHFSQLLESNSRTASPNTTQPTFSLLPCLQVSRRIYDVALPKFYRDIKVVQETLAAEGPNFQLLRSIDSNPSLAPLIRTLDLTGFLTSGRPWLVPRTLLLFLRLRSLHLQLGEMKQLSDQAIQKIFFGMPDLETLAIANTCPKTHPTYLSDIFRTIESVGPDTFSNIRSLTCRSHSEFIQLWNPADGVGFVDTDIFSNVLPRFPRLQALDLAYTSVNPQSLLAINPDTRLQFLRITNCQGNDTSTLAHFLATHTAVKNSLVVFDATGVRFTQQDTTTILDGFPPTLRSLNVSSSSMTADHVPQLQKLCRHLEELSVGHGLTMDQVEASIMGPNFEFDHSIPHRSLHDARTSKDALGHELTLGPMRDAIATCNLRRRLASVSPINRSTNTYRSRIRYLNLSSMDEEDQGRITNSVLLGKHSKPLELIVVPNVSTEDYYVLQKLCGGCGWRDKWTNGMVWVERG